MRLYHLIVMELFDVDCLYRNLDAILVQSRLSDLDILIADLAFSDASTAGLRHAYNSSNNGSGNGNLNGSGKSQLSLVTNSVSSSTANIRQSQTRKLTRDDIEWHSRDSKYGETKERSHSGSGDTGSFHKLPEGFNVTWSSCKIDEKKSDTSNTMEDYGYGAYGDDMRGGRGRSHSKDLESLSGVTKSIRSVKKKIQSIDELEQRLRDGLIKELNEEQCEKVSRRESLQSELKRLTLICTRLEGEERVKSAAKVQREKAASELVTSSKSPEREPSEPPLITSVAFTEIIPKQLVVTAHSGQKSTKSNLRSRNNLISSPDANTLAQTVGSVPALTSNSTSISKSISTLGSSSSASQLKHSDAEVISGCKNESSNSSASSASSVSKAFTPPSFNDWLKVTEPESISKATNISVPHKSTAIAMTPESTVKKGWGTVATFMDVSKENEAHPMRSVQIKKSSTTPIPSVLTTPIKGTFTPQSPAISTTGGKGPAPISLSKIAVEKDENTERQSVGISLADLMITPKKQNSKKNTDTPKSTREFASVDSTNLFSTPSKIVPSCPWLSLASKSLQIGTPEKSITNSSLKIKAKTFSEIQIEEETARLESNIHSLKGNDNPWYQERRKRADSIEEVIRSQAEEKIQEEENRKEEENAIREVELLKKREKREKMKLENTIQRAKSKSKAEGKQKADTGVASTGGELGAEADSGNAASAVVSMRRSDSSGGPAHRRSSVSEDAVVSDGKTPRGGKTGGRERGSGRGRGRGPVNPEATSCSSGTGTLELNPSPKPFVPAQSALSVSADTITTTDIPNAPPINNNSHGRGQGRGGRGAGERGGRGGGANGGKKPNNENSTHNLKSDLSKCAQEGTVDKSDTILAHVEKRNRRGSNNIKSAGPSVIDPNLCERKVQIQP